ncbi:DUF6119 family protein [Arthrobacter sp. Bz4]|uniref:DUF6119 family protein n=1 Tax=Arthrobacter sp. Bz4 TaxID=2171979 RepID=UPI0014032230|nr:DUF6119 family protein [Arthrobacter sp. Bz4]
MSTEKQTAKLRFNCYLLRDGLKDVETALRSKYRSSGKSALQKIDGSAGAPAGSIAYLGTPSERTPKWAEELDALFPGVAQITNKSNRLVIFLPVGTRWFAICFGYGSGALEWEAVEGNFGLRLAARRFQPDDVTELRSRRIDASARTQSVQVPVGTDLKDMGIELEGEFVRKLSGRLEAQGVDDLSGAVVAGDSIAFKAGTDLHAVQTTLKQMVATVTDSAAREEFQFVDSLEPLRTSEKISKDLDIRLANEVLNQDLNDGVASSFGTHVLEFAPPDDLRIDEVEDIIVSFGNKSAAMSEFTLSALRLALAEVGVRRGISFLRGVRLIARGADGDERSQLLPLRNWLIFEAGNASIRYVLTLGRWFRLQEAYTGKLNADLKQIADVSGDINLPDTIAKEHEGAYNARAANGRSDLLLMDTVPVKTDDGTRVEACDLLHFKGHLIHVKRYNGSQTLSHLFSQGAVSAELLNGDSVMKSDFIRQVALRDQIFEATANSAPEIVTYAIAIKDSYDLPLDLPTFSKVNLRDFAKRLRRMKVRPTLARIRVQ